MQAGSEYLVILDDRGMREAYIQPKPHSIRQRKVGDSQSAAAHMAHLLTAMRHGLMRVTRLSPSASAMPH